MGNDTLAGATIDEVDSVVEGLLAGDKEAELRAYVNQLLGGARENEELWTDNLEMLRVGLISRECHHALYTATDEEAKQWTAAEQFERTKLIEKGVAPVFSDFHSRILKVLQWKHGRWVDSHGF